MIRHLIAADRLVLLSEVLHHAGNGLAPARIRAELLRDWLETLDILVPRSCHDLVQIALSDATEVLSAIDTTMARLRALEEEAPHENL
jgi:hypothetical protein